MTETQRKKGYCLEPSYVHLMQDAAISGDPAEIFRRAIEVNDASGLSLLVQVERLFEEICVPEELDFNTSEMSERRYNNLAAILGMNTSVAVQAEEGTDQEHDFARAAANVLTGTA